MAFNGRQMLKALDGPRAQIAKGNGQADSNAKGNKNGKGKGKGKGKRKGTYATRERTDLLPNVQWACQECTTERNNPNKKYCR